MINRTGFEDGSVPNMISKEETENLREDRGLVHKINGILLKLPLLNYDIVHMNTSCDTLKYKLNNDLQITHLSTNKACCIKLNPPIQLIGNIHENNIVGKINLEENSITLTTFDKTIDSVIISGTASPISNYQTMKESISNADTLDTGIIANVCNLNQVIIPTPIIGYDLITELTKFDKSKHKMDVDLKISHIITKNGTIELPHHIPLSDNINENNITGSYDSENYLFNLASYDKLVRGIGLTGEIKQIQNDDKYKLYSLNNKEIGDELNMSSMMDTDRTKAFTIPGPVSNSGCIMKEIYNVLKDKNENELSEVLEKLQGVEKQREFKGKEIAEEIGIMLQKKYSDYGSAVYDDYKKLGIVSILTSLNHKMNRLINLTKKGHADVEDESFVDTLKDLAGYSICGLDALGYHHNEGVK